MVKTISATIFLIGITSGLCGCLPSDPSSGEDDANFGELVLSGGGTVTEVESNDDFDAAMWVDTSVAVRIEGHIDSEHDYDVFAVDALGERVRLNALLETPVAGDVCLCVFDDQQRLLGRSTVKTPQDPRTLSLLLPDPMGTLFFLASVPQAGVPNGYSATISVQPSPETLPRHHQVVLLNFGGAETINVAGRGYSGIPPFDAASIDSRYTGRSEAIIQTLLERVRADYEGVNVEIYLASDAPFIPGPYATIYFGGSNPDLLGVADGVDPFNHQIADAAMVYTDTFRLFSILSPSEEAIAQVLANVTTHEIGHLLGLRHTSDPDDIMDVTATAPRLMSDQWFKRARLHRSVCPLGYQDSPAMLSWTVGGQLSASPKEALRPLADVGGPDDFNIPRSWLGSHCALDAQD